MLLLLACVGQAVILDDDAGVRDPDTGPELLQLDTGAEDSGAQDSAEPADTDSDTDMDTGAEDSGADSADDTGGAPVVCDPAWGDLSSAFDGAVMTEAPGWYQQWPILGEGAICSTTCAHPWAMAALCDLHGDASDALLIPAQVDDSAELALCVLLDPPADASGAIAGACDVETSSGMWTLSYTLNL